jgi:hypothetical protein
MAGKMDEYVIESLAQANILNAYPLVQLTDPGLGLESWKRQARAAIGTRAGSAQGILVARRRLRQHISGMVWYRTERDFAQGRVLAASNLIAVDLIDPRAIMLGLVRALGRQARLQGCRTVRLVVAQDALLAGMVPGAVLEAEPDSRVDHYVNMSFRT